MAEAALAAGATIVELGTPLLKYEGVRNVVPIFRQRFPKALLLADMKTLDGGEGEANAVYSGGGNIIDFLALRAGRRRGLCAVRDAFRLADPAIPRLAFADVLAPMQGPADSAVQAANWMLDAGVDGVGPSTTPGEPTPRCFKVATCTTWRAGFSKACSVGRRCR